MAPTYTPAQLSSFPWIVSSATLRTEDLIPALSSALAQILSSLERPPFELSSQAEELLLVAESGASSELSSSEHEQLSELCSDLFDLESSYYAEAYGSTEAEAGRDFAQSLAEDTLELSSDWPLRCIDWEQAWQELRQDGYVLTPSLNSSATYDVWLPQ